MSRGQNEAQELEFRGAVQPAPIASPGAAPVPDCNIKETQLFLMTAATTLGVPLNPPAAGSKLYIIMVQDATGGRTMAWNAIYRNAPAWSAGSANQRASAEFRYDGVGWQFCGGSTAFA